ncbi:hypothetical protein MMC13_000119 [Lambiella insularis]|nr:hypothetical protein [Lambiella insularis]
MECHDLHVHGYDAARYYNALPSPSPDPPSDSHRYDASLLTPDMCTGTPYPFGSTQLKHTWNGPTLQDKIEHVRRQVKNPDTFFPNLEAATCHLETLSSNATYLSTPKTLEVRDAIDRLSWLSSLPSWTPDVMYKAFDDLDLAIFGGALRGYCNLRWETAQQLNDLFPQAGFDGPNGGTFAYTHLTTRETDYTFLPACYHTHPDPYDLRKRAWRGTIYMNATKHFLSPLEARRCRWHEMWGTLLHEMVHAYFRFTVDKMASISETCGPDADHGVHFQRCVLAVNKRAEELGLDIGAVFATDDWTVPDLSGPRDEYGRVKDTARSGFGGCKSCDVVAAAKDFLASPPSTPTSSVFSTIGASLSRSLTPASDAEDPDSNYVQQLAKIAAQAPVFVSMPPTAPTQPVTSMKERLAKYQQLAKAAKTTKKRA